MKTLPLFSAATALFVFSSTNASAATLLSSGTSTAVSSVNLTTAGTTNWAVWNNRSSTGVASSTEFSKKATGAIGTISAITTTNTTGTTTVRGTGSVNTYPTGVFTWTGGTASVPSDERIAGVFHSSLEQTANGVQFSITDLPTLTGGQSYLVNVYFTAFSGTGSATATTGVLTQTQAGGSKTDAGTDAKTTDIASFSYNPDLSTDTLGISVILSTNAPENSSHALIQGVAISVIPEPSSALLCIFGGLLLVGQRRR